MFRQARMKEWLRSLKTQGGLSPQTYSGRRG